MLAQATAELPLECCGLLAGPPSQDGLALCVRRCYPLVNAAASPTEYESEAHSILAADKDMRAMGWTVLAIFHSHPTSPPVPSRKDVERNYYGDTVVHLIISLQSAQPEVRGWWLTDAGVFEADWKVVED